MRLSFGKVLMISWTPDVRDPRIRAKMQIHERDCDPAVREVAFTPPAGSGS